MNKVTTVGALVVAGIVALLALNNIKSLVIPQKYTLKNSDKNSPLLTIMGENNRGQLGVSASDFPRGTYDIQIPNVDQVETGRTYSLAKTKDGKVWSWGGNDYGQLGYSTDLTYSDQPKEIEKLNNIKKISSANNHTLALDNNGQVYAFGSNFSGQLGNGENTNLTAPTRVEGINEVEDIDAGYKFSLAMKKNGTVWAWGASCTSEDQRLAEEWWKSALENISNLQGTYYDPHSDGVSNDDVNEYCVNEQVVGILSKTPIQIKNLEYIDTISAGYGHALAINNEGEVWSFGCNTYGQLGRETKVASDNANPQKITSLKDIEQISAGFRHSLALQKDGILWGWGQNTHGQLGTGDATDQPKPIKIPVDNVQAIVAAHDYSLVVKNDGTVWGWGRNVGYLLASSDVEYVTTPVQLKDLENVLTVSGNTTHILAINGTTTNN